MSSVVGRLVEVAARVTVRQLEQSPALLSRYADPIAYLEIAAILLASSLAATWIPAVRATRVEPAVTLRGD